MSITLRLLGIGFLSLVLGLVLTPIVREFNRRLGMVDKPDPRRINKVPIPRGGGVAVFLSTLLAFGGFVLFEGVEVIGIVRLESFHRMLVVATGIVLLGYADDKWSLSPRVKLAGQLVAAFLVWFWAGLGFRHVLPWLPAWLDCLVTVFWITGAVNAFNLIDGLDGLAAGLALIGTIGMGGALVFTNQVNSIYFHAAFAGALLGFLRYNYNPASVFLGDSGSMLIGFTLASLPLCFGTTQSFFVSVGVPLLAMGVPIFDTALAIIRRSIRHLLARRGSAAGNDRVMTADTDHLHHRILRRVGLSQRKAAWTLYGISLFLVSLALVNLSLSAHKAGLWLAGLTVASVIVAKNFSRIELYDAGKLLADMAHDHNIRQRRKYLRLAVPIYLVCDCLVLVVSHLAIVWLLLKTLEMQSLVLALPIRVFSTFVFLTFFRVYRTVWARAMLSNYVRLFLACAAGSIVGTIGIYYAPGLTHFRLLTVMVLYTLLPFAGIVAVRMVRPFFRDLFYSLDCGRLINRKDVSRILVYGAGLRYFAFRRELVRSASSNHRIIVGLLDDDILLRGHFIGGIQIKGTINDAPEVINQLNVDAVVIACQVSDKWLEVVRKVLAPTGVKITHFNFTEEEV